MEIILQGENCIITPLSPYLSKSQVDRLFDTIIENRMYNLGINLDYVCDCSIEFIDMIKNFKNLNIYNIQSDIFAIFNKMGLDKRLNLYSSEIDFLSHSHRLLNRTFEIIIN